MPKSGEGRIMGRCVSPTRGVKNLKDEPRSPIPRVSIYGKATAATSDLRLLISTHIVESSYTRLRVSNTSSDLVRWLDTRSEADSNV